MTTINTTKTTTKATTAKTGKTLEALPNTDNKSNMAKCEQAIVAAIREGIDGKAKSDGALLHLTVAMFAAFKEGIMSLQSATTLCTTVTDATKEAERLKGMTAYITELCKRYSPEYMTHMTTLEKTKGATGDNDKALHSEADDAMKAIRVMLREALRCSAMLHLLRHKGDNNALFTTNNMYVEGKTLRIVWAHDGARWTASMLKHEANEFWPKTAKGTKAKATKAEKAPSAGAASEGIDVGKNIEAACSFLTKMVNVHTFAALPPANKEQVQALLIHLLPMFADKYDTIARAIPAKKTA